MGNLLSTLANSIEPIKTKIWPLKKSTNGSKMIHNVRIFEDLNRSPIRSDGLMRNRKRMCKCGLKESERLMKVDSFDSKIGPNKVDHSNIGESLDFHNEPNMAEHVMNVESLNFKNEPNKTDLSKVENLDSKNEPNKADGLIKVENLDSNNEPNEADGLMKVENLHPKNQLDKEDGLMKVENLDSNNEPNEADGLMKVENLHPKNQLDKEDGLIKVENLDSKSEPSKVDQKAESPDSQNGSENVNNLNKAGNDKPGKPVNPLSPWEYGETINMPPDLAEQLRTLKRSASRFKFINNGPEPAFRTPEEHYIDFELVPKLCSSKTSREAFWLYIATKATPEEVRLFNTRIKPVIESFLYRIELTVFHKRITELVRGIKCNTKAHDRETAGEIAILEIEQDRIGYIMHDLITPADSQNHPFKQAQFLGFGPFMKKLILKYNVRNQNIINWIAYN